MVRHELRAPGLNFVQTQAQPAQSAAVFSSNAQGSKVQGESAAVTGSLPWYRDPLHIAVHCLGIAQITSWGTSYYCLGVLAKPLAADLGWGLGTVFLGFSISLIVMAIVSAPIGRLIDRRGARVVMAGGTVLVTLGLLLLSQVREVWTYFAVWGLLGVGMRACLYDAAFAALVQVVPTRGRKAISYLTLYGAYASTIFWVIGHYINDVHGWRRTLIVFAIVQLAVCLPLNLIGLAWKEDEAAASEAQASPADRKEAPVLEGRARTVGIALFALIMSLNSFVFAVMTLQLVPLLEAAGIGLTAAVWVASLKGHGQFAGRLVEIIFGRHLKAMTVARIAIGVLPLALLLLLAAGGSMAILIAFTLLMGASQGVISIVRGAVPLALFGGKGYGEVLGYIATPILFVNALSPAAFAGIVDLFGWEAAKLLLLAFAALTWVAIEMMTVWYKRALRRPAVDR
jgi:MFS family permease